MATTAIITNEDAAKMVTPVVSSVVSQAQSLTVVTGEDYELACVFLQGIAGKKKQVKDVFDPIVTKAHEAHKEALAQMKKFMSPLEMAEAEVKRKVLAFQQEQERLRREEERRQAEALRQEAERKAIEEAAQLEAQGEKELAEIVLQEAAAAPAPVAVVPSFVPKATGISARDVWKWRVKGDELQALKALVIAAAKDDRLLAYLCFNEKVLTATAKAQKSLMKVPGIETFKDATVAVRA